MSSLTRFLSVKNTNLVETVALKSFHILGTKGVALFRLLMTARPYRVHFGGFFALKQWISSSLKHDIVPRVNNLYCFMQSDPQDLLHYGMGSQSSFM